MPPSANDSGHQPRPMAPMHLPVLSLTGLSVAFAFLVSTQLPPPLMLVAFAELLLLSALVAACTALLLMQRPNETRLVLWDKALFLTFGGLLAGLFVDVEAVRAFVEANAVTETSGSTLAPRSPT